MWLKIWLILTLWHTTSKTTIIFGLVSQKKAKNNSPKQIFRWTLTTFHLDSTLNTWSKVINLNQRSERIIRIKKTIKNVVNLRNMPSIALRHLNHWFIFCFLQTNLNFIQRIFSNIFSYTIWAFQRLFNIPMDFN